MVYVDGFVLIVKKGKEKEYIKMAKEAGKVWKKMGALSYTECIQDDINLKKGQGLPYKKLMNPKPGEKIWYSFITYRNRKHRDSVNKKVHAYFMKKYTKEEMNKPMPFDMKKMSWGGFESKVNY